MIIQPKIRGFICINAHPVGCAAHVNEQIAATKEQAFPTGQGQPKNVLVIGASTGYGLASRITAAFGYQASTLGIFFEKPPTDRKTASAGYYNSAAFEHAAHADGLYAKSINGDAFSNEIKQQAIDLIKADLGKIDLVVYSLASPRRTDPNDGAVYSSTLKPIGQAYTSKNLNTDTQVVGEISVEPANDEEIANTVKVMGGEDWEMWIDAMLQAGVLAEDAQTVAYSYIGPEVTWPIYKNGTIGKAKEDVERAQVALDAKLAPISGKAWVSVNKALVTQASSAIPVVPLYISLLYKAMKDAGSHEDTIEQMDRLLRERLYNSDPLPDEAGRIRIDDWEMSPEIQSIVAKRWEQVTTENLAEFADFKGYQAAFLRLFGFGLDGVDYAAETDTSVGVPSLS